MKDCSIESARSATAQLFYTNMQQPHANPVQLVPTITSFSFKVTVTKVTVEYLSVTV
jgi:hypothetical protein